MDTPSFIIALALIIIVLLIIRAHETESFERAQSDLATPDMEIEDVIPPDKVDDKVDDETKPDETTDDAEKFAPLVVGDDRAISIADGARAVALTYDAAVAQHAIARRQMQQRAADANVARTVDYWRPIFEEELEQCENRDWWDDILYPGAPI
jgi:hypothetical protein